MRLAISRGTIRDYHQLAPFHYRAGDPASPVRILVARHKAELLGVLVVSMPVLNGPWRTIAWPGRFNTGSNRARAVAINHPRTGIRCITRVIVDPRARGLGIARRLVTAYLRNPLTTHTEALAAMGAISPFFVRAGMKAIEAPKAAHHQALARALLAAGIQPHHLCCPTLAIDRLRGPRASTARNALRRWARASRATRRVASGPLKPLIARAAATLSARQVVFVALSSRHITGGKQP